MRSDIELQPEDFIPTLQPSNIKSSIINRIYTLDIPLLYGYNFVKQGPYELAFFTGPKFKYILKENNHIDNYDIRYAITTDESLKPFTVNYLIGCRRIYLPAYPRLQIRICPYQYTQFRRLHPQ